MVSLRQIIKATLGASDADLANGIVDTCLNPLFKDDGGGARQWLTYSSGETPTPDTTVSIRRMFQTWEFPSSYTADSFEYPAQSSGPNYAEHVQGLAAAPGPDASPEDGLWFVASNDDQAMVSPPQYGRWQAGIEYIGKTGSFDWLKELNLDPRHRGAASRGTKVVQEQQDSLMHQAWEQVGQLQDVNKLHKWAQFSRQVGGTTHQRLLEFGSSLDGTAYRKFQLLAPVLDRVTLSNGKTALGSLRDTDLPGGIFSPTFRRLLRSRGPHFKDRLKQEGVDETYVVEMDLATCSLEPTESPDYINSPNIAFPAFYLYEDDVSNDPPSPKNFRNLLDEDIPSRYKEFTPYQGEQPIRDALQETIAALDTAYMPAVEKPPVSPDCSTQNIPGWLAEVEAALDPENTLVDYMQSRITLPSELVWPDDALAPVIVAPEFPQPMYVPLAERYPDLLLPGIGELPNNSVTAMETNPHFIESYMSGLNHEMSREFLWQEYPCDLRGTFFRQFWDIRGVLPQPQTKADREELKDIKPIHQWAIDPDGLGQNMQTGGGEGRTVVLFRGELFKRYPNAIVYAVPAQWNTTNTPATREPDENLWPEPFPDPVNSNAVYPMFSGHISPDIRFFGFELTTSAAKGTTEPTDALPGYFFVIQQPPTDTRLGLDEPGSTDPSWDQTDCYDATSETLTWGCYIGEFAGAAPGDSASMAQTMFQKPFRIAIHADELIV